MAYASAQDMRNRYPEKDLRELTDELGAVINDGVLDSALADASDLIDGYLRGRYALPLLDVPRSLVLMACTIAMYNLQQLRPVNDLEDARNRYKDIVAQLRDISQGKAQLALSDAGQPAAQTDGPIVVTATRTFNRDSMRGL